MKRAAVSVCLIGLACLGGGTMNLASVQAEDNPHAYFNALSTRPEMRQAYSLRNQAQLDSFSGGLSDSITYRPANDSYAKRQDAAKVTLPGMLVSIPSQVWLPINLNSGSVLLTWDGWWAKEWQTERGLMRTMKTFQISTPYTSSELWWEIRTSFVNATAPDIALVDTRMYAPDTQVGPGVSRYGPGERLIPMVGNFIIKPETWTRFWALIELRDDPNFDRLSLWAADETRDAVQIYNQVEVNSSQNRLTKMRLEYNSSGERTSTVPLIAYVRNFVALQNVASPTSLFVRPGGGGELPPYTGPAPEPEPAPVPPPPPPPTSPTAPSAPKNLRIVPPSY